MTDTSRPYRQNGQILVPAVLFSVLGLGLLIAVIYCQLTGTPFMVSNGKHSTTTHAASPFELGMMALGALITFGGGAFCWVCWKNQRIDIDDRGITGTDFRGRKTFLSFWDDLESIEERQGRGGTYYALISRGKRLRIDNSYRDVNDLIDQVRSRAPHLVDVTASSLP